MKAPACSKNLWKPVFATKSANQKHLRKQVQLVSATPRDEGSSRPNAEQAKRLTMIGDKILHNVTLVAEDVTIASTMMGITTTQQMSAESPSANAKEAHAMKGRTDPQE
eukprot:5086364-Ditylum_brightwellii.AAC.1